MPTNDSPPISCYIRTFNEEARIVATVRAALAVSAEVIVVDSESSDATTSKAEEAGARVISQRWLGFGHQKRVGEEVCRHDWLLDLDADEIVTDDLAGEIRNLFANGEPMDADVYLLHLTFVDPSGRIWKKARPDRRAKLYNRLKVRIPAHGAWDQFRISPGLRVKRLVGPLLHYAFDDIAHLSRKQAAFEVRTLPHLPEGNRISVAFRVYFGLPWFVFRSYVLRRLWKEGAYGFLFSLTTAYNHWLRYAMLHERRLRSK